MSCNAPWPRAGYRPRSGAGRGKQRGRGAIFPYRFDNQNAAGVNRLQLTNPPPPTYIAPDNLRGVRLFTTTGYSHHFEARNPGMLGAIAKSLFGSSNDSYVKSIFKTV